MYLEKIESPADLSGLNSKEMISLAGEIREEMIQTVSQNGGHLASNLGVVELTLALHRVFHAPKDKIIFDVGHQSYVHKMITGRYRQFKTLRAYGGISGFPKRGESKYDCFETGHASTAISAALGFARARDYRHEKYDVVALVGDGALTGGMCYEALNDAGNKSTKMIVVLNDNEMSIAPNVGALSAYLTRLRISGGWQSAKKRVRHFSKLPLIGKPVYRLIHGSKRVLKSALLKDAEVGFFEALGFQYFGPIDGHDMDSLEETFRQAKAYKGPCVIHVLTKKGYGYDKAENQPEIFHGTPPFYIETGDRITTPECRSCGHIAADTLAELSEKDSRIVAVTAAMKLGTGMDHYAERFPDRVIDVGIAEEHAATMCAGMAAGGMKPYFAVYSSFFQRCYDQMIHDIAMQNLPVTFLMDRSGIGGEDGQTHHGLFDFAALLPVPNMRVFAPGSAQELVEMIRWSAGCSGPCAIRYPKYLKDFPETEGKGFREGKWMTLREGEDAAVLAVGSMVCEALKIQEMLSREGLRIRVVNCSSVKPMDEDVLRSVCGAMPVFTMEEHMLTGGFGAAVTQYCVQNRLQPPLRCFGVSDRFVQHGSHTQLMKDTGLNNEQIRKEMQEALRGIRP